MTSNDGDGFVNRTCFDLTLAKITCAPPFFCKRVGRNRLESAALAPKRKFAHQDAASEYGVHRDDDRNRECVHR